MLTYQVQEALIDLVCTLNKKPLDSEDPEGTSSDDTKKTTPAGQEPR